MKIPRIVIAGATSGVGKTSVACAVIRAIRKSGRTVRPFKVGPDYIDPGYLSSVSGAEAYNLDVWLMGKRRLLESFVSHSDSDVSVIEGVMGYYDGSGGDTNNASTHHVASITKSPVLLVLDAGRTARSIAATALGFQKFHRNSRITGIILNRIGSKRHETLCRAALNDTGIPVVGVIPRMASHMESRHLGLVPTPEDRELGRKIRKTSDMLSRYLDTPKILKMASSQAPLPGKTRLTYKKPVVTIAVALDASFNFYYQDNLEALRMEGATLKFFSPIRDKKIPRCDGLYIGGGFPEVLADKLEKNHSMKKTVKRLAEDGMPLYAECGGLMYLTRSITYGKKRRKMAGLFDADTVMTGKMLLNYTRGKISAGAPISGARSFQGHEFHYSRLDSVSSDSKFACKLDMGRGIANCRDGLTTHNTLASYGHLYFGSGFARAFVKSCSRYSR